MPIGAETKLTSVDPDDNGRAAYVRKADRGFAPAGLPVTPSRLGIAEAIYEYVKTSEPGWAQTRVWASGLKTCARQTAMNIMGFPKTREIGGDNPEWNVVSKIGTALHTLIIDDWMVKMGMIKRFEFRVTGGDAGDGTPSVSGKVDVEGVWSGTNFILDVKTVGRRDFDEGTWGRKFPGYVTQLNLYGRLTGHTRGVVLLVCRDSGRMQDYEVTLDPEVGDAMIERSNYIVGMARAHRLPEAEAWNTKAPGKGDCMFCPFFNQCAAEVMSGATQRRLDNGEDPATIE